MSPDLPAMLLREGLLLVATVGGPILLALLAVGFLVGVMQAATQINDPAVGFLPRLATVVAVCWLLGGWMMGRLSGFLVSALQRMASH